MTHRHFSAMLLVLSGLSVGFAGAAEPPAPPQAVPNNARHAGRWPAVNPAPVPAPAPPANPRFAGHWPAVKSTASTATALRPTTTLGPAAATTKRMAGHWPAVNPATSAARTGTRVAGAQVGRQAVHAGASRGAARLVGSVGKGAAGAAIIGGGMLALYGAAELAESGAGADLGASVEQAVTQGWSDVTSGNVEVDPRAVTGLAKDLLIGTPAALAVYGASEVVFQEVADPGKTLRDLQSGNIRVDTGEVVGLGAAVGASVAFGGPAGLLAYGTVKIVDQEIKDPGKTARDIKDMTGGAIDLEQTGKDIEKTGQDVGKAVQDVGGFVGGLFGAKR